ncbi:hypothetical protein NG799_26805 [Laspinema sp. D1]|uniref:Transposase n=1 Tax=Laspinema palackyanum D2a TaxID=2953684 RepID=A0ABT2MYT7_9CYAN|nr:hypothetical protein [Laspinema sp. D2a]
MLRIVIQAIAQQKEPAKLPLTTDRVEAHQSCEEPIPLKWVKVQIARYAWNALAVRLIRKKLDQSNQQRVR